MYGKLTIEVTETEKGENIQIQGALHRCNEQRQVRVVSALINAFELSPLAVLAGMLLFNGQAARDGYNIKIPTEVKEKLEGLQ